MADSRETLCRVMTKFSVSARPLASTRSATSRFFCHAASIAAHPLRAVFVQILKTQLHMRQPGVHQFGQFVRVQQQAGGDQIAVQPARGGAGAPVRSSPGAPPARRQKMHLQHAQLGGFVQRGFPGGGGQLGAGWAERQRVGQ